MGPGGGGSTRKKEIPTLEVRRRIWGRKMLMEVPGDGPPRSGLGAVFPPSVRRVSEMYERSVLSGASLREMRPNSLEVSVENPAAVASVGNSVVEQKISHDLVAICGHLR